MPSYNIGLTALRTSQYALNVVSNNIANAGTEGYHRRRVHQGELLPETYLGHRLGTGVSVNYVERIRNQVTEASLTNAISDVQYVDHLITLERQLEASFLNGTDPLGATVDQFFGDLTKLSSAPDESSQRIATVDSARRMAGTLRNASHQLTNLQQTLEFEIDQEVKQINLKLEKLNSLNRQIVERRGRGVEPHTELDQRDQLLNDLATSLGIRRNELFSGEMSLMIGTASIQQTVHVNQFSLRELPTGELGLFLDDSPRQTVIEGGRLNAMLEVYNHSLPTYRARLDDISREIMFQFDQIHATGVGTFGSFQHLAGARLLSDTTTPLNESSPAFQMQAGELTFTITDPTGVRRTERITMDPAVDSLDDVATRISSIANLSAAVNPISNQLQIFSQSGYQFDFTGGLDTYPDVSGLTGTSVPELSGRFTGDTNTDLTFEIEGSGEVGISSGLFVRVYGPGSVLLDRINIGNGYEAGTSFDVGQGVQLSLERGTVVNGEQFTTELIGQPDETGFLAALGMNTFFTGSDAGSIEVNPALANDHTKFAGGKSSNIADTANLFEFIELRNYDQLAGDATISEALNQLSVDLGLKINSNQALSESLNSLKLRIEQDRDSLSGVDLNEEMVYLQEYQKAYEAAIRVIQAMDEMLNQVMTLGR